MKINGTNNVANVQVANNKEAKVKDNANNVAANYEAKNAAPTNADLYKAMYGITEKEDAKQDYYAKQMAEHRAKTESDIGDKKAPNAPAEKAEDNEYYAQYLAYKHKYE